MQAGISVRVSVSRTMFKMIMFALVCLAAFTMLVSAQRPQPCESPKQWEGTALQVVPNKNISILCKMSYDALNQRVRIVGDAHLSGKRSFFEYIMLFRKRRVYRIEYSAKGKRTCTGYRFNKPFRPASVPKNYNFATEAYIGASLPGAGVLVDVFYGDYRSKAVGKVSYVTSVTADGCVPVHSWVYSSKYGAMHSSFYNIVLGIEDPSRFIPPRKCKQDFLRPDDIIHSIY